MASLCSKKSVRDKRIIFIILVISTITIMMINRTYLRESIVTEMFKYQNGVVLNSTNLISTKIVSPITLLPRRTWVNYGNKKWREYKLPLMTSIPSGRLGNQMGEYATLYALHRAYNVSTVLHPRMFKVLSKVFDGLSIKLIKGNFSTKEWKHISHSGTLYNFANVEIAASGLMGPLKFAIVDTTFEMQLFNGYYSEIVKEFKFRRDILINVNENLREARLLWERKNNKTSSDGLVFVGFHIRRTDYAKHLKDKFGANLPSFGYFKEAMQYYKDKYRKVLFVMASDDSKYLQKHFVNMSNTYISNGTSSANDMALLSSCNHSIITLGSFGFWTAYLAGGEVVYPEIEVASLYRFSKPMYEQAKLDRFIPIRVP